MAEGEQLTPKANRIHIAFFGLRNAGKSTLVNAFCGQSVAIVSATPGTTTDPVSKAMEILPLGPCLITDTAGLDDVGELGEQRVQRTLAVLATSDIAVWVASPDGDDAAESLWRARVAAECQQRQIQLLTFKRGDSVEGLKDKIAALKLSAPDPRLLDGLVDASTRVVLVCPIDESAPKGRLILPQVALLRECLDRRLASSICQPSELAAELRLLVEGGTEILVVTDSQAFREVEAIVAPFAQVRLTSFSILFARQKGDLNQLLSGLEAIRTLRDGDTVLIAEGCTHHRQCNDIGSTKIPQALTRLSGGKQLNFEFASGNGFELHHPALVVHCGGCMLTRREMQRRLALVASAKLPVVNYGLLLALAAGIDLKSLSLCAR